MTKKTNKKKSSTYKVVLAVLITTLIFSFIFLVIYAWNALELSSHKVSYTSSHTDIIGSFPEKRKFKPGEEVVVRAGTITKKDTEFIGWKDVNNVIESSGGILENGDVFIMPDNDVLLEAVWENDNTKTKQLLDSYAVEKPEKKEKAPTILKIKGQDHVNLRASCDYESDVLAKIDDSDIKIEYYGEHKDLHEEDEQTTYTWYYVKVPSLKKEGWIRSDLLSEYSAPKADDSEEKTYLMSSEYDSIKMYEDADPSSKIIETIEDNEISLTFLDKTKKTTNDDGDTITWYYVKNSDTGKKGWIEKDKMQYIETE